MQKLEAYDRNRLDLLDEGRIARLIVDELAAHPEVAATILNVVYNFIFDEEGAIFDSQRLAFGLSPRNPSCSTLNEDVHEKARHRMHYVFRAVILITARQNAEKTSGAAEIDSANLSARKRIAETVGT